MLLLAHCPASSSSKRTLIWSTPCSIADPRKAKTNDGIIASNEILENVDSLGNSERLQSFQCNPSHRVHINGLLLLPGWKHIVTTSPGVQKSAIGWSIKRCYALTEMLPDSSMVLKYLVNTRIPCTWIVGAVAPSGTVR